jgi:hypothetical protein
LRELEGDARVNAQVGKVFHHSREDTGRNHIGRDIFDQLRSQSYKSTNVPHR